MKANLSLFDHPAMPVSAPSQLSADKEAIQTENESF